MRKRLVKTFAALCTAVLCGSVAVGAPAQAGQQKGKLSQRELREEVERTLARAGLVGMSVEVRDGGKRIRARAGEAVLGTGMPVPYGASFRADSVTKPFVATVVLQLAAEGRLSLDDTVEKWLPGVVQGNGNDGRRITLRHLLQHTSGIHNYDYTDDVGYTAEAFEKHRYDHLSPEQIVAGAMRSAPDFPPADPDDPAPRWNYTNPGYILAGMVIQKVTGRTWAQEVHDRIVEPLGLTHTYAPGDDPVLPAPHARNYHRFPGSTAWTDTTERNMSWAGAAGELISGKRDVDKFFTALLTGRLLPPAQLAQMRHAVPVGPDFDAVFPGLHYGLGLMRQPLTCGGYRWGHGGDGDGDFVRTGFTADGRRSVVITASGKTSQEDQLLRVEALFQKLTDTALCEGTR
ncbi:beta-lactamase family protein [Streptomyces roseirectus]|uniref:Beta-lactamase family protein n=1 Tax=Streptomyces roseirectus TaxID=2768066 RepID=A0A7H0IK03_9ACTN|nr:serine hydrolase domain-containing protein [Streptomyces roseirectus]QNP73119.1 beta-lactamase family protein [Streptomyces roseirectus]